MAGTIAEEHYEKSLDQYGKIYGLGTIPCMAVNHLLSTRLTLWTGEEQCS